MTQQPSRSNLSSMSAIIEALGDPEIRDWYLAFCVALLVLPMAGLAWWYHRGIRKTEGGRRLMTRHEQARGDVTEAIAMFRDVRSGRYGHAVCALHARVYGFVGLWLVGNALAFGLLLWADAVNRAG